VRVQVYVQLVPDRRGDGLSGGLPIAGGILTICVIVVIRRPNVEVRRTLRTVARLLVSGVICVLDICLV
jgi:hypothetical protein